MTDEHTQELDRDHIKSYVLRKGRITKRQQRSLEEYADGILLPYNDRISESIYEYFSSFKQAIIEIGFGMGVSTAKIAKEKPETAFLGIEVFEPGVGNLLDLIVQDGLQNVRIVKHDAIPVLEGAIREDSIDGYHVFFPDPWPKKRHHKRRLLRPSSIDSMVTTLRPGGYLYIVTDWEDYAYQVMGLLKQEPRLENPYDEFAPPAAWRPTTKFEEKGLKKDHTIFEILYKKRV